MSIEWMISSSGLMVSVLLVRVLFKKKIPPCLGYALWLVVALRLLLPISISGTAISILNLLPRQDSLWGGNRHNAGQIIYEQDDRVKAPEELIIERNMEAAESDFGKKEVQNADLGENAIKAGSVKRLSMDGKGINISKALRFCHMFGAGVSGCVFLAVNLNYGRKLRRSRKKIGAEKLPVKSLVPVYESPIVRTPCLFGLPAPAVYVPEDMVCEKEIFRFALCHENMHYRQRDHWWALGRLLCLCLHWFNPLAWIAARAARQDGEMACDERTLKLLGDKARVDYGKALLALSAWNGAYLNGWRITTTMSGNARQMKKRLWMIVNMPVGTPGRRIFVLVLAVLLAVVTFTGTSRAKGREEPETGNQAEAGKDGEVRKGTGAKPAPERDTAPESLPASADDPEETTFYTEIVPVSIGGKEYELWCEGHRAEYFYTVDTIYLVDSQKPDAYVDTIVTAEISRAYWGTPEGQEALAVESTDRDGGILAVDLNFDGWNDLCFHGWIGNANIAYYCMLWNPEESRYEYSTKICNVEIDEEKRWIMEETRDGGGRYSTTCYRYDENNQLHMVKYAEENLAPDAVFENLELVYVEDAENPYALPAIADGRELHATLIAMAKQALTELYRWTGAKVDAACFQVTDMGGVAFGMTPEDIMHSRIFLDRQFGADTAYNLSNYEKSISSLYITSGRSAWYSPVLWHDFPDRMEGMTEEEIIIWYLERIPTVNGCRVKSVEKRYEDMWTIQTQDGDWFEVGYDVGLREITMVAGPYPDIPVH